jgi:ABC-type Fe3+/spermidine/putrescine transport system ATPase subunit
MAGASIRIDKLCKRYGSFVAVEDVSLDVKAGEFVTLLGLSGSGKTSTLMAVAGFVEPDAGHIEVNGRSILHLPPEKRDLGVVFQNYALFPHLNVFDNVAFPLRMRRQSGAEIDKAVRRLLDVVGLGLFAERKISSLSGGQQQRVALARALVFEPPVLLMDEPLGALDRTMRDQLQTEIKRIQRDLGVTVLYVTHDQEEALALSDRIAVMAEGRICQMAPPDEIYEKPKNAFVAHFIGESNFFEVLLKSPAKKAELVSADLAGLSFVAYVQEATIGTSATMAVRPEAIKIGPATSNSQNPVAGTIRIREFLGSTVRLTITTAIGDIVVRQPRTSGASAFQIHETVQLHWSSEDALLFNRDA